MLKPKVSELIQYRIPDWVAEKEQFLNFIKYYYDWLEQKGNSVDFLRNLVEYNDIDETTDEFIDLIIGKITAFVPNTAVIDKKFLAKNIRAFIRSKGSDESMNFILKAIFGEDAYRLNMSEYVLRASDNEYAQDGFIAIEVTDPVASDFNQCLGSTLYQTSNPATLKIQSTSYHALPDGRMFYVLQFDPRFINGQFDIGAPVKAMKREADPTFIEVTTYETVTAFNPTSKVIRVVSESELTVLENMVIENLDDSFIGVVDSVQQHFISNNLHDYNIILKSFTGSPTLGELVYLVTAAEADSHLNLLDFCFGTVSNSVGDFDHIHTSSGYYSGLPVEFRNGTGAGIAGKIGVTASGGVDNVLVLRGGANYQVGDPVVVDDTEAGGYGFEAVVSNVDGFGAEIEAIMEIDKVIIRNGGTGYTATNKLYVTHLNNLVTNQQIELTINTVSTAATPTLKKFKILNSGKNYTTSVPILIQGSSDVTLTNNALVLNNASPTTYTTGTYKYYTPVNRNPGADYYSVNASVNNYSNSIIDVEVTTAPTPAAALTTAYLAYNGFGAVLTATVGGGIITNVGITKAGINYVDPAVRVSAPVGTGALIKVTRDTNGKINGFTILSGGTGYTSGATLQVYDRAGEGFVASTICDTATTGAITGITVTTNNEFAQLPMLSENIPYATPSATTGYGAVLDITYKVKRLNVINQGAGYLNASTCKVISTSGIGLGLDLSPVIVAGALENVIILNHGDSYSGNTTISFDPKAMTWSCTGTTLTVTCNDHGLSPGDYGYISFTSGTAVPGYYTVTSVTDGNIFVVTHGSAITSSGTGTVGGTGAAANIVVNGGKIVEVDMTGSGSFYTPDFFHYTVNPTGAGSGQSPVAATVTIQGTGAVLSVSVAEPGYGYTPDYIDASTQIYIDGDYTVAPVLVPTVFTGVDRMIVENNGGNTAFNILTSDPWRSVKDPSGIVQVVQLKTADIEDTTGFPTKGKLSWYVNKQGALATYGKSIPWVWISKSGSGHTHPYITIGDGAGVKPVIRLGCSRKIESVTVSAPGSGLNQNTQLIIVGTGRGAMLRPVLDGEGGISTVTISGTANTNKGYVGVPTITVDDSATIGSISEIMVTNPGTGYSKFPILKCEVYKTQSVTDVNTGFPITTITGPSLSRPKPALGAKLLAVSDTIGGIRSIDLTSFGYGYDEVPDVVYPMVVVVDSVTGFQVGDEVSNEGSAIMDIGAKWISLTSSPTEASPTSNNLCTMLFSTSPTAIGMYAGQKVKFNTAFVPANLQSKTCRVISTDAFTKTAVVHFEVNIPAGTYVAATAPDVSDVDLFAKAAKIVGVDKARNMIWLSNIDNVYDYEQDISYLAEGDVNDGKTITTEYDANIMMNMKLINHKNIGIIGSPSYSSTNVIWMSHGHSFAKQTSIGETTQYFKSLRGMTNHPMMRVQNSLNIQDYSLEVHTGLSLSDYDKILKETVHPAGYYLAGVFEDTTYLIDQLRANLPLSEAGRSGDFVFLGIAAAWASLYYMRNYSIAESKELFRKRFDGLSLAENALPIWNGQIQDFDIWKYPENNVYHIKTDTDQRDYHIWGMQAEPVHLVTKYSQASPAPTGTYSQTAFAATVSATSHGFKNDDWVNIAGYYYKVSGATTNTFNATGIISRTVGASTPCTILKAYDGGYSCAYTRSSNLVTITSNAHGLISSINTWVLVSIPTTNSWTGIYTTNSTTFVDTSKLEYKASYCRVTSVTGVNTFVIDTKSTVGAASGTLRYWKPQDIIHTFDDQVRLYNIPVYSAGMTELSYTDNGATITLNGLPTTHTLMPGNILYATWGSSDAFVTVTSKTSTTVTFSDPGISGALNISFTLGQSLPPQPGYGSLTEYVY